MSRLQVKENQFRKLIEEEGYDDSNIPEPWKPVPKEVFQPGVKKQPLTPLQNFQKVCGSKTITNINELSNILDESLRIRQDERLLYCEKYANYEKYDIDQYEELIDRRLNCFASREEEDLINEILSKLPETITFDEIVAIVNSTISSLSKKRPSGHGGLFLVDLLMQHQPELFNNATIDMKRKLFPMAHENISNSGPVVLWLIGRALNSKSKVNFTTHELMSLFLDELLNHSDVSNSGPFSVYASHLIRRNVQKTGDKNLTSRNCVRLMSLYIRSQESKLTNRDQHVIGVLKDFLPSSTVIDVDKMPKELFMMYPKPQTTPKFVLLVFTRFVKKENKKFIDGWVKCVNNPELSETALAYLDIILRVFPNIIHYFPAQVLNKSNNEIVELQKKKDSLHSTSIRFVIVLIIAFSVLFLIYNQA